MKTLWCSLFQRVLLPAGTRPQKRKPSSIRNKSLPGAVRIAFLLSSLFLIQPPPALSGDESCCRLIGTIRSTGFTGAVVDNGTGGQVLFRLHERLPDGSQIVKVKKESISLKRRDGSLYELFTIRITSRTAPVTRHSRAGAQRTRPSAVRGAREKKPNYGWGSKKRNRPGSARRRSRR